MLAQFTVALRTRFGDCSDATWTAVFEFSQAFDGDSGTLRIPCSGCNASTSARGGGTTCGECNAEAEQLAVPRHSEVSAAALLRIGRRQTVGHTSRM